MALVERPPPLALRATKEAKLNDAEFDVMSTKVEGVINAWQPLLGLENWKLQYHIHRGRIPGKEEDVVACCGPDWQYQFARMDFSMEAMADHSDEDLEESVLHELLHCVIDEVCNEEIRGSLERVTTNLSRVLQRVRTQQPKPFARQRRKAA